MVKLTVATVLLAMAASAAAQCGSGSPEGRVEGNPGNYRATRNGQQVYQGGDYRAAIQAALDNIGWGQRVAVYPSGDIGASTITVASGKILEVCGTMNVGFRSGRGAIESLDTQNAEIRYLTMTGNPYFGMRFYGTQGLKLGRITFDLNAGLAIRFERDRAANSNVSMDVITCNRAGSHCVETWNINNLTINQVIARNVGECGLLLQKVTNARVNLVDGNNVAAGNGYATLRFANENGKLNGGYPTNIFIERVVSRGGGRGIFCVSQSGGAQINNIDLANNGNNAILIENCYNMRINGGQINGGGEVRLAARSEFANNRDIWITARVDNTSVRESPCGDNTNFYISGNARMQVC